VQCYVAVGMSGAIVAFRGTQPDQWRDVLDDVKIRLVDWDRPQMQVHRGFRDALDRVWTRDLKPALDALGAVPVWFTGHSLGAALATLAADRHGAPAGVVTLGLPRVGDGRFCRHFDARHQGRVLRYVRNTDVVAQVPPGPPLFPYDHVAALRQIARDGRVGTDALALKRFLAEHLQDAARLLDKLNALMLRSLLRPPRFLLDHMPRGYAVDIWNDFVRHGD
jgi:pimeloyl-ACP methyl ester carboxylesterase